MLLAQQDTVIRVADVIARSTMREVGIGWQADRAGRSFEQYLLDRAAKGRISGLIGLRLWFSRFTPEELAAAAQLRLQHILDYKTQRFLRVTAGVKRFGPVRFTFWTVEAPGR